MKRVRRRYWNWLVTGLASVVLLAAVLSGLFQIAVQAVPGYREQLVQLVSRLTGRPVSIGAIKLTWRYYYPSLDLGQVALLSKDGARTVLAAERLRLGFSLARLVTGNYTPDEMELSGLELTLRVDAEGRVRIQGIEAAGTAEDPAELLKELARFDRLLLQRCNLRVRDPRVSREALRYTLVSAELAKGLLSLKLRAELVLPAEIGKSLTLRADLNGDIQQRATWSGVWTAQLTEFAGRPLLRRYLMPGARVDFSHTDAQVQAVMQDGRFTELDASLESGPIRGRNGAHVAAINRLDATAHVLFDDQGWRLDLTRFVLESDNGPWPVTQVHLRYDRRGEAAAAGWSGDASFLRLADLAPWLTIARVPFGFAGLYNLGGDVEGLQWGIRPQAENGTRYSLRGRFSGLNLPAEGRALGFSGLSGEFAGDEAGGRVVLNEGPAQLLLPGVFTQAVPIEAADGELAWQRREGGWQLGAPRFRLKLLTGNGSGNFRLWLPDEIGRSPELNLSANFSAEDSTAFKPFIPKLWHEGLRGWLTRAIVSARVPEAELNIVGPLKDFPFDKAPGTFRLDLQVADAHLAYQPDWPSIERLGAMLKFRGNSLTIESNTGAITGNRVEKVVARFPDFRTGELLIDGRVTGETARFYEFLAASPLQQKLEGLLAHTRAQGPAAVDVHLNIPLREADKTQASGKVTLQKVELRYQGLEEPITGIAGELSFGPAGVAADSLKGRLYGLALDARITPQAAGSSLLSAELPLTVDPAGKGVSSLIPFWLRQFITGRSRWRVELPLGGEQQGVLKLSSDLQGIAVNLPQPLGKTADTPVPFALTVGGDDKTPLRVGVDYQGRLGADLQFAGSRGHLALRAAALRLGAGAPVIASGQGLTLLGTAPELDLRAWSGFLLGAGLEGQALPLQRADLYVSRGIWGEYSMRETRMQLAKESDAWVLNLVGPGASGQMRWKPTQQGTVTAKLDNLALDVVPEKTAAPPGAPLDPSRLPVLDFKVGRLTVGGADLGRLNLVTTRIAGGQQVQELSTQGGQLDFNAAGQWRRTGGNSSGELKLDLNSSDIATVMRAFAYAPSLDAKKSHAHAELVWAPDPQGLRWTQATGPLTLEFENGQLRAVEPGAGRVLGLINFYALPRRLTLNFRDVVSKGLGFDRIHGNFTLADGQARTEDLEVDAPSLRMQMRGRIGLADRDYDQYVTVYPDLSAGATLAAAFLGGPAVGALVLIAQEVLDKPFDQVTKLSYHLTGSWDNPQVERVKNKR